MAIHNVRLARMIHQIAGRVKLLCGLLQGDLIVTQVVVARCGLTFCFYSTDYMAVRGARYGNRVRRHYARPARQGATQR